MAGGRWVGRCLEVSGFTSLVLLLAGSAQATCYSPANEGVAGDKISTQAIYDGIQGGQYLRNDATPQTGRVIAHPVQVAFVDGDFTAVGTYKGDGPDGLQCPDDYDADWTNYTDGATSGVYYCVSYGDGEAQGTTPSFEISYGFCPFNPAGNRWRVYWAGALLECRAPGGSAAPVVSAGAESGYGITADQNLDVGYRTMHYNATGGTIWFTYGTPNECADPSYTFRWNSATSFDTYLAPW
jgi:hypothetical protein